MRHIDLDDATLRRLVELDAARIAFASAYSSAGKCRQFVIQRFGSAIALRDASQRTQGLLNRVVGFGRAELQELAAVLAFYEDNGIACQIDVTPNHATPELLQALQDNGFRMIGCSSVFRGVPEVSSLGNPEILIERATGGGLAAALDLHRRFGERPPLSDDERSHRCAFMESHPEYQLFVASIDGQPAAVGALLFHEDLCHLSNAVTDPAKRGRGCQRALLEHRIGEAARAGCRMVVTDTMFGNTSHRNAERAGFRLAYATTWWVRPPPAGR